MLTDAAIRRITLREKPFTVGDIHGLHLLVQPNGARYWRWNFSHRGKRQALSLGVYPEISLKAAREKRAEAKKAAGAGCKAIQLQAACSRPRVKWRREFWCRRAGMACQA